MSNEELQSKTISFLRFPLIVGVVLAHSTFSDVVIGGIKYTDTANYPIFSCVSYLFSQIFSHITVPLFFFISGFLFFYKTDSFTGKTYLQKLKKRTRTILVPYIFWNLLIILFYFLSQTFFTGLMSGRSKLICDYSITDWLWAFGDTSMINEYVDGSMPINYPLWFIRDLIVVIFLSPLIYFLVKKLGQSIVICLGILWMFDYWFDIVGFSSMAFFFFSAGAYFSIYRKNFVEIMSHRLFIFVLLYMLIAAIELYFSEENWIGYLHNIGILVGIVVAITISAHFIKKGVWKNNSLLSNSSFLIYVYHAIPLAFVIKFLFKFVRPHAEGSLLILYIICPAITILVGLLLYYLLKKYLPAIAAVITGGR